MGKTKKVGSTGRFGSRYGRTIRERVKKIELKQRKLQICPYCRAIKAKRISTGIYFCKKCKSKFTGRAYSIKE